MRLDWSLLLTVRSRRAVLVLPLAVGLWLGGACAPADPPAASLSGLTSTAHAAVSVSGPPPNAAPLDAAPGLADQVAPPIAPPTARPTPPPTATPTIPPPQLVRDVAPPRVSAQMAVVLDEASGAILYGRDENREVAPASLTKIVTAMVALELGHPSDRVTTDVDSRVMWDSTIMGLVPGEEVSLEDLLYGMMLPSGNDAAIAIARYIAGSETVFADLMNAKVRQLGLQHTHFMNPHGLEQEGHYSSPYDMAMLAREAMRNPFFRRLAAAKQWDASGLLRSYHLVNLNRLLWQYPGADGVKIGYEDTAINTMVVSAVRDGHRIYASFMRSTSRDADGTALLNYAFNAYAWPGQ
ncbi:MAG TPA: D-alanyl-D-alanine carboxypeptidase family protein [Chloroflexota bacterium]|nr:D-alanyl-D-alanine carboxypeptidase family protein [Chloroflexota bacterium]